MQRAVIKPLLRKRIVEETGRPLPRLVCLAGKLIQSCSWQKQTSPEFRLPPLKRLGRRVGHGEVNRVFLPSGDHAGTGNFVFKENAGEANRQLKPSSIAFLIRKIGSGSTQVEAHLGQNLRWRFVDLPQEFEKKQGQRVLIQDLCGIPKRGGDCRFPQNIHQKTELEIRGYPQSSGQIKRQPGL